MRILMKLGLAAALLPLASCYQLAVHAQAGYAQMKVDGRLGYVSAGPSTTTASIDQDFDSAFGIGDAQGAPYARVSLDTGVPVIAVSGFDYDEQGQGVLQANFGDTLTVGAPVNTDLHIANLKASYALQISLGPVSLSPGIAADYFDLDFKVSDTGGIANEEVQLQAPVPLAFLRGEVDLGVVSAFAEVGYLEVDIKDVRASLLDIEAQLQYHPNGWLDVYVGYRSLQLQADGTIDGGAFDTNFTISGFVIGGGFSF